MDSKFYQRVLDDFTTKAENYMDFYLSHPLLKSNIEDYIDCSKFNKFVLKILDEYLEDVDNDSDTDMEFENNEEQKNEEDEEKLYNSINDFIIEFKSFYKFNKEKEEIIEDIFKVLMNSTIQEKNRCVECNIDMGLCNPRQLCGKLYCMNED
jgi:hypothetical protein